MSLSAMCIVLVLLSLVVAILPTIISGKKLFYYWKTIFTIHFFAGLIGIIDIVYHTIDGKYVISHTHQILFFCILVSCVASYILRTHLVSCGPKKRK